MSFFEAPSASIERMSRADHTIDRISTPTIMTRSVSTLSTRWSGLRDQLPRRQERLVLAWAELHEQELRRNWKQLQAGKRPFKIEPLR